MSKLPFTLHGYECHRRRLEERAAMQMAREAARDANALGWHIIFAAFGIAFTAALFLA